MTDAAGSDDPSLLDDGDEPVVRLVRWTGPVDEARADAGYLHALAGSGLVDPVATVRTAAARLGVPAGALVRHVLAEWASAGAAALLAAGPTVVEDLVAAVRAVDEADDDATRDAALAALRGRAEWLAAGLEDPSGTYPAGGAGRARRRRVGVYGLASTDEHVLLVRVARGYPGAGRWTLPGGGLDFGEDPLDGLVREFGEETGLVPEVGEFLLSDSHHLRGRARRAVDGQRGQDHDEDLHLLRFVWRVQVDPAAAVVVHEVDGSTEVARWIPLAQLPAHRLLSVATRALAAAGLPSTDPDRTDGSV